MKLIAQSDDYGITKACAAGAVEAIRNGIIRNTGYFTNMPWAEEIYPLIKPFEEQIALGIDLNASTGPSLLGHDKVPALTHEDGMFFGSRENRAMDTDENNHNHLAAVKDQLYAEFDAQIKKYIEITGHKPDYIHNHAYGTETTAEVTQELADKYGCITSTNLMQRPEVAQAGMGWYQFGGGPEAQLKEDMISYLTEDKGKILASGKPYGYLVCHCGWCDAEIFRLSSFNTCRAKDLEAVTSEVVKNWVRDHNIELITFKNLPQDWITK